jgi:signal peptidase I
MQLKPLAYRNDVFKSNLKPPQFRPKLNRKSSLQESAELLFMLLAFYCLGNLLSLRFVVDGVSMNPTFQSGQFLLVSRIHYMLGQPQRGDIVVFHLPQDSSRDFIKRVIALPHEAIEIRDTQIYINGTLLVEPYLAGACTPEHCSDGFWQLGANEYFLLGDNRNQSYDSRFFGAVSRQLILGEALLSYWPLTELAWIENTGAK